MDEIFAIAGLVPLAEEEATAMNEQEFRSLYDATARPILAYLVGVTGRRDVAEDLLQETYCRFLAGQPPTMNVDETRRYLFRIATNLLRDRWRRGDDEVWQEVPEHGFSIDMDVQIDVRAAMRALKRESGSCCGWRMWKEWGMLRSRRRQGCALSVCGCCCFARGDGRRDCCCRRGRRYESSES